METDTFKAILRSQFGAAIETLQNAIDNCPDELWDRGGSEKQYWYIAYHCLFFLDLYLSKSVKGFSPPQPFTLSEIDSTGKKPPRAYSREELKGYIEHCRTKCISRLESLTEEQFLERCGFSWIDANVAELMLYNMRHVQHRAGQLNLILRQEVGQGSKWVFKSKT